MTTYRVIGTAHGSRFDERGFETSEEAEAYASEIIDGDYDSTIDVVRELGHPRFTCADLACELCSRATG
jgi:hypothetical protein